MDIGDRFSEDRLRDSEEELERRKKVIEARKAYEAALSDYRKYHGVKKAQVIIFAFVFIGVALLAFVVFKHFSGA